jgi:DNA-binding NarL/FixJ family response regulator
MLVEHVSVLVVKAPGRVRDGLCSLLSNQPRIKWMGAVPDSQSLWEQIEDRLRAGVVLLDRDACGSTALELFHRLKAERPQVGCILLVDTAEQQAQAFSAGASETLIKGFSADELLAAIWRVGPTSPVA